MSQRIGITGASGFIGTALTRHLQARGDLVVPFVRDSPTEGQRRWQPKPAGMDPADLADLDAVVHLAGAGVGDHRWTPAYKELILRSRVEGTSAVAEAVAARAAEGHRIRLVSASAIGYYGDRGAEILTEHSEPGVGFLAEVVQAWEAATGAAVAAGAPVAMGRVGLVMAGHGGAFATLIRLTRWGLSGPLGGGRQWWSWVSLADVVAAFAHLLDHPELTGPVNLVGPDPRPQVQVAAAIAATFGRPNVLPAPAFALRLVVGEFAGDILGSQRVLPDRLVDSGFDFRHATVDQAAASLR